jgi:hypothetical protein
LFRKSTTVENQHTAQGAECSQQSLLSELFARARAHELHRADVEAAQTGFLFQGVQYALINALDLREFIEAADEPSPLTVTVVQNSRRQTFDLRFTQIHAGCRERVSQPFLERCLVGIVQIEFSSEAGVLLAECLFHGLPCLLKRFFVCQLRADNELTCAAGFLNRNLARQLRRKRLAQLVDRRLLQKFYVGQGAAPEVQAVFRSALYH